MIFKVEPLADPHFRVEIFYRWLWCAVFPDQSHVKMTVIRTSLTFLVTGRGLPFHGQIQQAVPKHPVRVANQQLTGPLNAESLHFIRTEGGYSHFRHPNGQIRYRSDFVQFLRPIVDLPMVPIQWKAMYSHCIQISQQTITL